MFDIYDIESMAAKIKTWQAAGEKVVFTNGCFDILHLGHVTYLAQAAALGGKMVVAVNDDASVKRLGKSPERPINPEHARAAIISQLKSVAAVVIFKEDTPLEVIKALRPDILAKGADYDANETDPNSKKYIVGSQEVRSWHGEVKTIALVDGFSTTGIVGKMKG